MGLTDYEYHLYEELKANRLDRRGFLKAASVVGLGTSAAAILAACGTSSSSSSATTSALNSSGSSAGTPKRGGALKVAMITPTATPEPVTMYDGGGIDTVEVAGEFLCWPDPNYVLQPRLATSWTPDATGKVWTFKLRQGVKFHSGASFSADDVVATYERLINPASQSAAASTFKGILSAGQTEKVDQYTVAFHLDRPYVDFPYLTSVFNYNAVILPKNYQIGDFAKGGVGTGAFILKQYNAGQNAQFVKNPNYWNSTLPYLDSVELVYFSATSATLAALESGAVDIITLAYQPQADPLLSASNVKVIGGNSTSTAMLNLRTDQAPFNDKRVRQALALSLDRNAILQGLFGGRGQIGQDHIFAPVFPTAPPKGSLPLRSQNIAQAKALLAAAGTPNVNVTLTTEQYREIPDWAVIIKQQAAQAGFNITLNIEPQGTFYGSGANQPWLTVPMGIVDWGERGSPDQFASLAFDSGSVWNSSKFSNPQFDTLMKTFESTVDLNSRRIVATNAAKILMDETPVIIAYWIQELRATGTNINGFAKGPGFPVDFSTVWKA